MFLDSAISWSILMIIVYRRTKVFLPSGKLALASFLRIYKNARLL